MNKRESNSIGLAKTAEQVQTRNYGRQIFRIGELFSGAGGMALGAHLAKYRGSGFCHVWANDNEEAACQTLRNNLPIDSKMVICRNVEELDFDSLPSIDGLAFGFPCNDFSLVGKRKGMSGQYGGLYKWGSKALKEFQPGFFVAENVSGLSASNNKKDINIILESFEEEGYDVRVDKYHFENYGIPQNRHRIIIVGFRKNLNIAQFYKMPSKVEKQRSAKQAITEPPIPSNAANNELTAQSPRVVERLKFIKQGENVFTADLPEYLRLNLKSGAEISQIYKRLKADEPAYTITGSGGGGTHTYHWSECRALTNRERARLQTFPDSFVFNGGKEAVRKQIGMAVPPEGARLIFRQILKVLTDNNIKSVYVD